MVVSTPDPTLPWVGCEYSYIVAAKLGWRDADAATKLLSAANVNDELTDDDGWTWRKTA